MRFLPAFDHADMELVRQREHRQHAKQDQWREALSIRRRLHRRSRSEIGMMARDENPERKHGRQFEQRFHGNREHEPAVVPAGITGTEQHGEHRHHQCDHQADVDPPRIDLPANTVRQQAITHRHCLELQRNIRNQAENRDQGDDRGETRIAAEASGDEIGDRTRMDFAGAPHQPDHRSAGQCVQQDGADEGRRQRPLVARGLGDGAEERPRCAVHRQRQCVDPAPMPRQQGRSAIGEQRRTEHEGQPRKRHQRHPCTAQAHADSGVMD